MRWHACPRILSEHLAPLPEPLTLLLRPGGVADPPAVAAHAARALLDLAEVAAAPWPAWLAPHQVPAAQRLAAIIGRFGGALLADAVGLGKSYVALAVACAQPLPLTLVVPAVLVPQWKALLARHEMTARVMTHEALSRRSFRPSASVGHSVRVFPSQFVVVDEAHRFRNADTRRYHGLASVVVGSRVLLVTATPVHNCLGDLFSLFRLFLRDHALTALGIPSLRRAARGECDGAVLAAVAARLIVARSRTRVRGGYAEAGPLVRFPRRRTPEVIRAGTAPAPVLDAMVAGIGALRSGGAAATLFRLTLLRRLASSLPALQSSLARYDAYVELSLTAAQEGRALTASEFQRLFPRAETADLQLALFPLLLGRGDGGGCPAPEDRAATAGLRALGFDHADPKAATLERLLHERDGKTIVFTEAAATARYLVRWLQHRYRVAAVFGRAGSFAREPARRAEVLAAFAPGAQGAAAPPPALETDVLIATDLLSEGLNLQDATRVVHYDLPWSPARLAQRVGRIDRLGSPHEEVETVTFLPPEPLAGALRLEERLAAKVGRQSVAGAAQLETASGPVTAGALDWCDRLQALAGARHPAAPAGAWATVGGAERAAVLVVRIGALVETLMVDDTGVRADPVRATALLEVSCAAQSRPANREALDAAIRHAAPLVRERLSAIEAARWRAEDRDRLARRLIPWVLSAARRAARRGDARELVALDGLVSRLTLGMTAGEEVRLEELLARRTALAIRDLLAWHEALPPVTDPPAAPAVELVAAVIMEPG
ncbi:MAG: DEAD/DEAH box helicase [Gemmatimonadetes bacterium]|nr:DEAD/DEAH box helicase [Gemmatimonadota bacterium]